MGDVTVTWAIPIALHTSRHPRYAHSNIPTNGCTHIPCALLLLVAPAATVASAAAVITPFKHPLPTLGAPPRELCRHGALSVYPFRGREEKATSVPVAQEFSLAQRGSCHWSQAPVTDVRDHVEQRLC